MEQLKRNSSLAQRPVTLRDVEDGAVNLRKVGETLATLKGKRRHMIRDGLLVGDLPPSSFCVGDP